MTEEADLIVSLDASQICIFCGSENWVRDEGNLPHAKRGRGELVCNDCGERFDDAYRVERRFDIDLGLIESTLLRVLDRWDRENGPGRWVGTLEASSRLVVALRKNGGSFVLAGGKPWFGLDSAIRTMTTVGLVEYDVGMAQFVPHGEPTPEASQYWLRILPKGRALLNQHDIQSELVPGD